MRLLQIMVGAEHGGAEEYFVRLAIALGRRDINQRIIIRNNKDRASRLQQAGIQPHQFVFNKQLGFLTRWNIKKIIKSFEPDIVLSWMNRATQLTPNIEDVVHVGRLGGYYDTKYYKRCDHLIANTHDIYDYLLSNGWDKENVHYLPNFVSINLLPPIARIEFQTPARVPLILAIGRLHENKAFDILVEALAKVPDAYLWLAGDGPLRRKLEEQAKSLGIQTRIRFLGWRNDVEALFAASDIFVCPSRYEPLGNVVIEAWANDVPVIATDSIGPANLVGTYDAGVLVPVDDVEALAISIKRMIQNKELQDRVCVLGKKAYQENFTEKIVLDKYIKFFESIIS